jgi:hypothetical protein
MPEVKPKFTVKWSSRNYVTFPVPANTYEEMFKFFQTRKARKEDWGKFDPTHTLQMVGDKDGPTTEVRLTAGYTIALPAWSKATSIGKKGKGAWDTMLLKLKKHEDAHADIFEEQIDKLSTAIAGQVDINVLMLNDLHKEFMANLEKAQNAYDARTAHGEKEGVFLPPPDKVKD